MISLQKSCSLYLESYVYCDNVASSLFFFSKYYHISKLDINFPILWVISEQCIFVLFRFLIYLCNCVSQGSNNPRYFVRHREYWKNGNLPQWHKVWFYFNLLGIISHPDNIKRGYIRTFFEKITSKKQTRFSQD